MILTYIIKFVASKRSRKMEREKKKKNLVRNKNKETLIKVWFIFQKLLIVVVYL